MQFSSALRKATTLGIGLIATTSLILVGCGGGGGGGTSTPAPSSLGGVTAVGYPIVSGTVQVKCASSPALNTTTSSTGTWQVILSGGQTLPCAIEVSSGTINNVTNNTSYHSVTTVAGTVNVTPLTDLMVANLAAQAPSTWFAGLNSSSAMFAAITQANIDAALTSLRTALSGLAPLSTINPITTSFTATPGNASDDMLTALQAAISNTGSTYATVLNAASTNSFTSAVAALNAVLPSAYAGTPSGSVGSDPGITGVFPTSATPGTSVTISGTNFRQGSGGIVSGDAYRVSFNGTTTTPYLRSLMQLAVIVPTGATTGTLTVTDLITNQVYTVPGGFTVTGTTGGAISATATTTAQSLTVGTVMASFSPLTLSGGVTPYTYSHTGTLPTGLSFSTTTGVVTGTPTATYTTANLVFSVKDANNVAASTTSTVSFSVGAAGVITSKLINDTGITATQCYQAGSSVLGACNSAAAVALNNEQDGMVGRDANADTNSNTDGKLGFSFTSATGGCVQDNVTGLIWEVKTIDGGLRDWTKTYTNYDSVLTAQKWNGTVNVVPTQAEIDAPTNSIGFKNGVNAQGLCGFNDWRLPTAEELQSIVDYGVAFPGPTIDITWFPNTQGGSGSVFWSSSLDVSSSLLAWFVGFGDGFIYSNPRSNPHYVLLVRAGQTPTAHRYTVSTDGQDVTDNQTNLIWRRCAEGMAFSGVTCIGAASMFTHEAALQRAAAQASSTGIAWRLPNVKELSSIDDRSLRTPAIDQTTFPATPIGSFWSASPYVGNSGIAWDINFVDGGVYGSGRSGTEYVRLVRGGQ